MGKVAQVTPDGEIKWCPTQSGQFTAYEPEFREKDGEWQAVPTLRGTVRKSGGAIVGSDWPLMCGGVMKTIGLYGYAQAHSLAWSFACDAEAGGHEIEVRVAQYEVHYDIKAKRLETTL